MDTNLVNQKCSIVICDPWDLGESISWKPLEGTIIKQGVHFADGFAQESEGVILKLDDPFDFKNISYQHIELLPRQGNDSFQCLKKCDSEISCDAVRVSKEQVCSNNAFNLSWWRGGGAFECILELA